MTSLQARLFLTLLLVGGSLIALKTLSDLGRAEAPVTARAEETSRAAMLEIGPRVERAFASGRAGALREALAPLLEVDGAGSAAVVDANGALMAGSPGVEGADAGATILAPAFKLLGTPGDEGPRLDMDGSTLVAALPVRLEHGPSDPALVGPPPPAPGAGFVLASFDFSAALAAARGGALRANVVLALGLLLMMIVVGAVVELSLGGPARRVAKTIERFELGERAARTGMKRGDLGRIGKAFDDMAERLQLHEEDLLETKRRLETALKCVPVGVMVVRRDDGRPIYVNPRWKELFGIPMDATRDILSLLSTVRCERADGSPYPLEQLPIPAALRSGRPAEVRDLRVRRDDAVVPLLAGAVPVSLWRTDTFDAVVAVVEEPGAAMVPEVAPGPEDVPVSVSARSRTAEDAVPGATEERGGLTAFPVGDREPAAAPPGADEPETILVVEGEDALRALAEQALAEAGYRVLVTGSASDALTFFRGEGHHLRAVVLDLWVPGSGERPLLDELLDFDPTARIIAASGYRPDMPQLASSGKVVAFLPKPYGAERMLAVVREVVERGMAEAPAGH